MAQTKPTYAEVYERHNWMYAPPRADGLMEPIHFESGLEVGPGWVPLLDDALTKIGEEVRHMQQAEREHFALVQIKEKFGELCVYHRGGNERISQIVGRAEDLSRRTCEQCGDHGLLHVFHDEWFWTLCASCARQRALERNLNARVAMTRRTEN